MMKHLISTMVCWMAFSLSGMAQEAFESLLPGIKQQAMAVMVATRDQDAETIVEYTHPNVIELLGGQESAVALIDVQLEGIRKDGFTIDSISVSDDIQVVAADSSLECLVPNYMSMTFNGGSVTSHNHLYGFSYDEGKKWVFIEAAKLKDGMGAMFFPDFSPAIAIPDDRRDIQFDEE